MKENDKRKLRKQSPALINPYNQYDKFTKEKQDKFLEMYKRSLSVKESSMYAGINKVSYYRWLEFDEEKNDFKYPDFVKAVVEIRQLERDEWTAMFKDPSITAKSGQFLSKLLKTRLFKSTEYTEDIVTPTVKIDKPDDNITIDLG